MPKAFILLTFPAPDAGFTFRTAILSTKTAAPGVFASAFCLTALIIPCCSHSTFALSQSPLPAQYPRGIRVTENIHHIHRLRNIGKRGIHHLPDQGFSRQFRIHRNHPHPVPADIPSHDKNRAVRFITRPRYGDCFTWLKNTMGQKCVIHRSLYHPAQQSEL